MEHADIPVRLNHPSRADLRGSITFKSPNIYTEIAIQRRVVELANTGARDDAEKLHPSDLAWEGYELCVMVSTLEHVIETAPSGLYTLVNNRPVLALGQLASYEAEAEGVIRTLYAAYVKWRARFREHYYRKPEGVDEEQSESRHSPRSEEGQSEHSGSTGTPEEPTDDRGD